MLDQLDLVGGKAGDGHGDPVLVIALLLDVVGRLVGPDALIEHVKEPVETDRRTIVGSKVKSSHSHILREATWICRRHRRRSCRTLLGLDGHDLVERKKASRGPPKFFRATRELVFDAPVNLGRGSRASRTVRKQRFKNKPPGGLNKGI
jgi:hypothetical protein